MQENKSESNREVIYIPPNKQTESVKLRVAAYARVSSDSVDQLDSFTAQVKHYTDLFQSHTDWEMVDIYADEGLTGLKAESRPEFQRLLTDCKLGRIDRILTKSISRFSRNTKDCLASIRMLKRHGVSVFFEKENIDSMQLDNELILALCSSGAQAESMSISGNMRRGCQMRMQNGTYLQSHTPIGYCIEDGELTIDREKSYIVRKIFDFYLSGLGMQEIASYLTEKKIPRNDGKSTWNRTGIEYILQNERYVGDSLFQKTFTANTLPLMNVKNKGQVEKYYARGTHTPIISKDNFQKVQEMIDKRRTHYLTGKTLKHYPFTGKIVCGECGTHFRRKVGNGKVYWVCYRKNKGISHCTIPQIPETAIELAFVRLYNKLASHGGLILKRMLTQLTDLRTRKYQSNAQVMELNVKIADLMEQNHALNDLKVKGVIDSAFCIAQTNELNQHIQKLRNQKITLLHADDEDIMLTKTQEMTEYIASGPEALETFDGTLFRKLVEYITVQSATELQFHLINGLELPEPIKRMRRT